MKANTSRGLRRHGRTGVCTLAELSFALYEASEHCGSVDEVAERLQLPATFVTERIEAARLCLMQMNVI